MIRQILYISDFAPSISMDDVEPLVESVCKFNSANDISGMLLTVERHFFQILEGEESILMPLMERISKDSRHEQVRVLYNQPCEKRDFDIWEYKEIPASDDGIRYVLRQSADHPGLNEASSQGIRLILKGLTELDG